MWGTHSFDRLRDQWRKKREALEQEISDLKQVVLNLRADISQKDHEAKDVQRAYTATQRQEKVERQQEGLSSAERLQSVERQWKVEVKALTESHETRVKALVGQLEEFRRQLQDREASWQVERIQLARAIQEDRADRVSGQIDESSPIAQESLRASEQQWKVKEAFFEGKIAWLTDQWEAARQEAEGRIHEFSSQFERMTQEVQAAAAQRDSGLRGHYEELVASFRRRCEQLEVKLHQKSLENEILKNRIEQREQAMETLVKRTDLDGDTIHQRLERERRTWEATLAEKDQAWRGHVERMEREIEAWKSAWEKREHEVSNQLEELQKAYRTSETKWHGRFAEVQAASMGQERDQALKVREHSKAFRDRVEAEIHAIGGIAAEVERYLADHPEEGALPREALGKLKVYRETHEYITSSMVDYVAKEGQVWDDRTAVETAVVKALETGRFALLSAQIVTAKI